MILPGNEQNTLPKIVYEEMQGTLKIEGRSIDIEAERYYEDLLPYLDKCLNDKPIGFVADIDYEYFNTKTAKVLVNFFNIIKKHESRGNEVKINWYYEEEDENLFEAGKDYESMTNLKFNFIEKPTK